MTFIIKAENLKKTYTPRIGPIVEAVRGISFEVPQGECIGLLGPNGAGKTTTMKMIMALCEPTEGSLTVFGENVNDLKRKTKARIGLVSQEDNLDNDLSARKNLQIYSRYYGVSKAELDERVPQLFEFMALEGKEQAQVVQLSGGMKRRLTIARALVGNPDLIILDEPTTGLDPQARVMIWQRLLDLKNQGKTLLLTTHYMDEAQRLCDRIVVIDGGEILDIGTPKELISRHVKPHVVEVSKEGNTIPDDKFEQEDLGNSVLYYVDDANDIVSLLSADVEYQHRPSNLEDVFLKLTGRSLRNA